AGTGAQLWWRTTSGAGFPLSAGQVGAASQVWRRRDHGLRRPGPQCPGAGEFCRQRREMAGGPVRPAGIRLTSWPAEAPAGAAALDGGPRFPHPCTSSKTITNQEFPMKRNPLALLLALVAGLLLSGCGKECETGPAATAAAAPQQTYHWKLV